MSLLTHKKIYFPNLNGLRCIAAFLVIIHHIEQLKSILHWPNYYENAPMVQQLGILGVNLFFVLSGFLITYLLLAEEFFFKKISIRKFYVRRILRIWPLYFLIVLLAFFVLPHIQIFILPGFEKDYIHANFILRLVLYLAFLPNLAQALLGIVPYVSHTWSIGTEEQFYLMWPLFLKYLKKYRIALMIAIMIFYVLVSLFLKSSVSNFIPYKSVCKGFWMSFNINCMAVGGIFAIWLFQKNKVLNYFFKPFVFFLALAIVLLLLFNIIHVTHFLQELYAILFAIIIVNLAAKPSLKLSLENYYLNYLGNISYGLYMYHPMAIVLSLFICKSFHATSNIIIYLLSIAITIGIASVSYQYFEAFFLKFKQQFTPANQVK
jgi:peptidoglycan/LPS O-acetylase OafA/YrhL